MNSLTTLDAGQAMAMPAADGMDVEATGTAVRTHMTLPARSPMYLSVGDVFDQQAMRLADPDVGYVQWIRVVLLRIALVGGPLRASSARANLVADSADEYWGIENLERFLAFHGPCDTHLALKQLLCIWEADLPVGMALPALMEANLLGLTQLLQLNAVERSVLAFVMLLHGEAAVDSCSDILGSNISAYQVPQLLASILGLDPGDVQAALADDAVLTRSELVTLDHFGEGTLRSRIDPISRTFAKRMFMRHAQPLDIVGHMIHFSAPTSLAQPDFAHVQERAATYAAYLQSAQQSRLRGANILLYGEPGTGKTAFARYLAQRLGSDMLEVGVSNDRGNPVPAYTRFRYYKLAQCLTENRSTLVLFDECEEVLASEMVKAFAGGDQSLGNKSWVNALLETNASPTIWIANAIHDFDRALLRRFDLVMEMPLAPQSQRQRMLQTLCGDLLSEGLVSTIAASNGSTPAMLVQTARVVKAVTQGKSTAERDGIASTLVNDRLAAQGLRPIRGNAGGRRGLAFDPLLINTSMSLPELGAACRQTGQGRMCVYGPPGTGKTAFGKWLAKSVDRPGHFYKASDLLAPHVGETERHIAAAFSMASKEGAVLQIDEVDSFLQERSTARQNWEVSLVNEMLTQIEDFEGIFVASTNRFEHLDGAVLRRLDLSLQFDYLTAGAAWTLFERTCALLDLPIGPQVQALHLAELKRLTPGDFEQLLRQCAYRKPLGALDVLTSLRQVVRLKSGGAGATMGFLH